MQTNTVSTSPLVTLDKQALTEIYDRYSPDIFRYACRFLTDSELAEDCVADTFHRFLMAVHGGTSFENIRAYLYRIAHNWITDHYRRHPPLTISLEEEIHPDSHGNPSILVSEELDRQRIRSALMLLPAEQRQVIELRFMEDWSHTEVAGALGKTVEATRALQYRAVEALRRILSE